MKHRFISLWALLAVPYGTAAVIPPDTVKKDVFGAQITSFEEAPAPMGGLQLDLRFDGFPGSLYDIDSSLDLENWDPRGTAVAVDGEGIFSEPLPSDDVRFYRVEFAGNGDAAAPTWPAEAALVVEDLQADTIDLNWPAANDDQAVVAYAVYGNGSLLAVVPSAAPGVFIDGLDANTVYELDLVACDGGGNSKQLASTLTVRTRSPQEPYLHPARAGSVFLANGEFTMTRTDLAIPARRLGGVFTRTYRSDRELPGPLGRGWSANVFERLLVRKSGDVVWQQGSGRSDVFQLQPDSSFGSPPGVFMDLHRDTLSYRLIEAHGTTRSFDLAGRLQSVTDRNGNSRLYGYSGPQLTSLTDDMGRACAFSYDANGRLEEITDFTGRVVRYTYDAAGNLSSVRSPVVTGTPNGNDFPNGKTERYEYDTAQSDPDLAHNLVRVISPKEVADGSLTPREVITYGTTGADHDRVLSHTIGGTNAVGIPAGGTRGYSYQSNPVSGPGGGGLNQVTVTDRRGNATQFKIDGDGRVTQQTVELAGRADPVTSFSYDAEGRLLGVTFAEGNALACTYDDSHSSRRSQGNMLSATETAGPRGASQPSLVRSFSYEPIFNGVRNATDARGFSRTAVFDYEEGCDFAAIGAKVALTAGEAQALLQGAGMCGGAASGDLNNDGDTSQVSGNVIRRIHPTVTLDDASNQAALEGDTSQEVQEFFQYNRFGQLTAHLDAEKNRHTRTYFAENDPDGDGTINTAGRDTATGGYLAMAVVDSAGGAARNSGTNPPITTITTTWERNERGAATARRDPRGIRTRFVRNALDQVVQVVEADDVDPAHPNVDVEPVAPVPLGYVSEFTYDANNNLIGKDVEDRGDTSNTGGLITTTWEFDLLDRPVTVIGEIDVATTRTTRLRYDANGNRSLLILPEGNAVSWTHEERNLLRTATMGATAVPAEALGGAPGSLNPRGGTPSTVTLEWDANGNLVARTDAADTDSAGGNNGPSGGDLTTFDYDGFDRQTGSIDAAGNLTALEYDANGNLVSVRRFGPDGGATPTDRAPSTNLLARCDYHYDELNRLVQSDRLLFANTLAGADVQEGAAGLGKGDLVPGDGMINRRYEYDRLGRRTFVVEDDGDTHLARYDGAGRAVLQVDPIGNTIERAFCDLGNVIEQRTTDVATKAGAPDEQFLTTSLYDAANRRTTLVDNLGHTTRYTYDSRHNLVSVADANGPLSGATLTRRAFPDTATTVNALNNHGNVTRYRYDGLGRRVETERVLTASGLGNGSWNPTPDPLQGGGDGLITTRTVYDGNDLVLTRSDDNRFRTIMTYDNLNRVVLKSHGSCGLPALAGYNCDSPTTIVFSYDGDHNCVQKTDEAGNVFDHTYDALNRLVSRDITPAPGVGGVTQFTFQYDGLGRLREAVDNGGNVTTTRHYDSLSRVLRETSAIAGIGSFDTESAWRAEDLRSELTYPNGTKVTYTYDDLDRVADLSEGGGTVASYDYVGHRLLEERLQNGVKNLHQYDGLGRASQVGAVDGGGGPVLSYVYTWDRGGNRLSETKGHDPANGETYAYDSAYRLIEFDRPNASATAPLQASWKLDGSGNWNEVDGETRLISSFNEVAGITPPASANVALGSDDNGNLTSDPTAKAGTTTYDFDALNRLIGATVSGGPTVTYRYDALGRRVAESDGANYEVAFLHDGSNVIMDWDVTGQGIGTPGTAGLLREFVSGTKAINTTSVCNDGSPAVYYARPVRYEDASGSQFLYSYNSADSVGALTPASGAGVERVRYDAYGSAAVSQSGGLAPTGNPYLHASRRGDAFTGLYYNNARYYDSELGRFLSRDPIGVWGDAGNFGNAYSYAGGNPVNRVDPSGRIHFNMDTTGSMGAEIAEAVTSGIMIHELGHVLGLMQALERGHTVNLEVRFLRADTALEIVFVSDEVDSSPADINFYPAARQAGNFRAFREGSLPIVVGITGNQDQFGNWHPDQRRALQHTPVGAATMYFNAQYSGQGLVEDRTYDVSFRDPDESQWSIGGCRVFDQGAVDVDVHLFAHHTEEVWNFPAHFMHELGHDFGMCHDVASSYQDGTDIFVRGGRAPTRIRGYNETDLDFIQRFMFSGGSIWINQGEIPASRYSDDYDMVDVEGLGDV